MLILLINNELIIFFFSLQSLVASCEKCSHLELKIGANGSPTNNKGIEESDSHLMQRVTELELELAQAKLAQVEAECKNQVS